MAMTLYRSVLLFLVASVIGAQSLVSGGARSNHFHFAADGSISSQGAQESGEQSEGSSWDSIYEQRKCEAMSDNFCPGFYGFRVDNNGHYAAGPNENGKTKKGRISPAELVDLNRYVNAWVSAFNVNDPDCDHARLMPGTHEQIEITRADNSVVRIYDEGSTAGNICYRGGRDNVNTLREVIHRLTDKYYPQPF